MCRKFLFIALLIGFVGLPMLSANAFWPKLENYTGAKKFNDQDYEEALNAFSKSSKADPSQKDYYYNLGNAYYKLNQFESAEQEYLKSLDSQDSQIRLKTLYNLGNTKYKQNDLESAIKYYDEALKIDPNYTQAKLNRDFVQSMLDKQKKENNENKDQNNKENQDSKNDESKGENQDNNKESNKQDSEDSDKNKPKEENSNKDKNDKNQNDQDSAEEKDDPQSGSDQNTNDEQKQNKEEAQDSASDTKSQKEAAELQKQRQIQRLLESIDDNTSKSIKEGILKDTNVNRKKIDKPW